VTVRIGILPLVLLGLGCDELAERLGAGQTDAAPSGARQLERFVPSERGVFELVRVDDGVALIRPGTATTLSVVLLDPRGARRREQSVQLLTGSGTVREIAAASAGAALAVAWVEDTPSGARAAAALGNAEAGFGATHALGPAGSTMEGGSIAVVASGAEAPTSGAERFVAFHRSHTEPCAEAAEGCTSFVLHELHDHGAQRRRVGLAVPMPCDRGIAGFAAVAGRWYYGVCARGAEGPAATLFTIEHSPEYAQAETLLTGCQPVGVAIANGEALYVARCDGARTAVRIGTRREKVAPVGLQGLRVECWNGKPNLLGGGSRPLRVVLDIPSDGIGPLLPETLAPDGARAVWTGKALLVATPTRSQVALRRYECRGFDFVETTA
jgi:hypothetical protein